jgi:hypothetical protein
VERRSVARWIAWLVNVLPRGVGSDDCNLDTQHLISVVLLESALKGLDRSFLEAGNSLVARVLEILFDKSNYFACSEV